MSLIQVRSSLHRFSYLSILLNEAPLFRIRQVSCPGNVCGDRENELCTTHSPEPDWAFCCSTRWRFRNRNPTVGQHFTHPSGVLLLLLTFFIRLVHIRVPDKWCNGDGEHVVHDEASGLFLFSNKGDHST